MTRGEAGFHATVASIRNDLHIADACGSVGTVVHFGHLKSDQPLEGYQNLIHCLDTVLEDWNGQAKILLENQAGDHGPMGTTMEEMIQIRKLSQYPEHIAFVLTHVMLLLQGCGTAIVNRICFKRQTAWVLGCTCCCAF